MSGDKSKLLTQNVLLLLLLQKNMERNVNTLKQKMKQDIQKEREKSRIQLQNMKVSFQALIQTCSTLHSFIPVLFSCLQTPYQKFISPNLEKNNCIYFATKLPRAALSREIRARFEYTNFQKKSFPISSAQPTF
jgi:hypothetical protein